jgi:pyruvate/2-oxoglutarate dehydrogenase complex dihydrolipoamide dehydrogenase (E3) component
VATGSDTPEYDIVVIGGGSAGLAIGKYAPRIGARVAVVESEKLGGDCTWYGCVPSKALLASAKAAHFGRRREEFGLPPLESCPEVDFARVIDRIHAIQQRIYEADDSPDVLRKRGCDVIEGFGRFTSPTTLVVGDRTITARAFCIATGSHPNVPPIEGLDRVDYLTNRSVFEMRTLPRRLVVIGAGPIGLELGQALSRLGSTVTILEMAPHILPREDPELSDVLRRQLEAEGVVIHTEAAVTAVDEADGVKQVSATLGGESHTFESDAILVAIGQRPNVEGIGLEEAGVDYDPRVGIKVDETLRTTAAGIYACGDVIGRFPFTHMAGYEAGIVMRNALFLYRQKTDYSVVPWATFTEPEVARVGLTEAEARERYGDRIRVVRHPFDKVDRAVLEQQQVGFVKLISVGRREKIVGAHIVGPSAGELIHEYVLAMQEGVSPKGLAEMTHVYPTLSEINRHAALKSLDEYLGSRTVRWTFRASQWLSPRAWRRRLGRG